MSTPSHTDMEAHEALSVFDPQKGSLDLSYLDDSAKELLDELEAAGSLPTLKTLDVGGAKMDSSDIARLSLLLKGYRALTELDVRNNHVNREGCASICSAISKFEIKLKILNFTEARVGDEGAHAALKLATSCPSLSELDLGTNSLTHRCATAVAYGVVKSNLTKLCLEFNALGDEGASKLAEGIAPSKTLRELNLSDNSIGDKGAAIIAERLLGSSSCLTQLDLSVNKIGPAGAIAIASALSRRGSLKELSVGCNPIGREGNEALVACLTSSNFSLQRLELISTEFPEDLFPFVFRAMQNNSSLLVDLWNNDELKQHHFDQLQKLKSERKASVSAQKQQRQLGSNRILALVGIGLFVVLGVIWVQKRRR